MESIEKFVATSEDCGYGYGCGSVSCFASCFASCYEYGCGSGFGFASGSPHGYGCGSVSGCGSASYSGDGSGSYSGYGPGCGIKKYGIFPVYTIDNISTIIRVAHGNVAKGFILHSDMTTVPCYVCKHENLFAHGETLEQARDALEEKIMQNLNVEEIIKRFNELFKPGVKYPNKEFYKWHHLLTGSCEMGRKSFAKDHGIDIEHGSMTREEFIELTKDSFGGEVIRRLEKSE